MTQLLVSVRSLAEAEAAVAGGAALIDIKEPRHGSLGRASDETMAAITAVVSATKPVSAALGELASNPELPKVGGLSFVKWGLAGCGRRTDWQPSLLSARQRVDARMPGCHVVAVAYADWLLADAPSPTAVCQFAGKHAFKVVLIDTWRKERSTLLDWLTSDDLLTLVRQCRNSGLRIALAGRLGMKEISGLLPVEPDWFAVRGAVCYRGVREDAIDPLAVRELAELLSDGSSRQGSKIDEVHVEAGRGRFKVGIDKT